MYIHTHILNLLCYWLQLIKKGVNAVLLPSKDKETLLRLT